jgi:hypothetical protein
MNTSTASTIPARTVLEIRAAIASCQQMLDTCDAFQHDLRNEPARDHDWVVGLPQYGRFLNRKRQLVSVTAAAIYACKYTALAAGAGITNGVGETLRPMLYRDALEAVLQSQLDLHTMLCGCFQDLHAELVVAQAYERHLDDTAEAERVLAEYRLDQRL